MFFPMIDIYKWKFPGIDISNVMNDGVFTLVVRDKVNIGLRYPENTPYLKIDFKLNRSIKRFVFIFLHQYPLAGIDWNQNCYIVVCVGSEVSGEKLLWAYYTERCKFVQRCNSTIIIVEEYEGAFNCVIVLLLFCVCHTLYV